MSFEQPIEGRLDADEKKIILELKKKQGKKVDSSEFLDGEKYKIDEKFRGKLESILRNSVVSRQELNDLLQSSIDGEKRPNFLQLQKYLYGKSYQVMGASTFNSFTKSAAAKYFDFQDIVTGKLSQSALWKMLVGTKRGDYFSGKRLGQLVRKLERTLPKESPREYIEAFNKISEKSKDEIRDIQNTIQPQIGAEDHDGIFGPLSLKWLVDYCEKKDVSPLKITNLTPATVPVRGEEKVIDTRGAEVVSEKIETPNLSEAQVLILKRIGLDDEAITKFRLEEKDNVFTINKGEGETVIDEKHEHYVLISYFIQIQEIAGEREKREDVFGGLKQFKEEFKGTTRSQRQNFQRIVGSYPDGSIGKNTYRDFKKSPLSNVFAVSDLIGLQKIGTDAAMILVRFNLEEGHYILPKTESGYISVYNPKTQEIRIIQDPELLKNFNDLDTFRSFSKEYLALTAAKKALYRQQLGVTNSAENDLVGIFKQIMYKVPDGGRNKAMFQQLTTTQIIQGSRFETSSTTFSAMSRIFGVNSQLLRDLGFSEGAFVTSHKEKEDSFVVFDQNNKSIEVKLTMILEKCLVTKNVEALLYLVEKSPLKKEALDSLKALIQKEHESGSKEMPYVEFFRKGERQGGKFFPFSLNFHGSKTLQSNITAFDLFKGFQYLRDGETKSSRTYRRMGDGFTEEDIANRTGWLVEIKQTSASLGKALDGLFATNKGLELDISKIDTVYAPSDDQITAYNNEITFSGITDVLKRAKGKMQKHQFQEFVKTVVREKNLFDEVRGLNSDEIAGNNGSFDIKFDSQYGFLSAYELFGDKPFIKGVDTKTGKETVYRRNDLDKNFYDKDLNRLVLTNNGKGGSFNRVSVNVDPTTEAFQEILGIVKNRNKEEFMAFFSEGGNMQKKLHHFRRNLRSDISLFDDMIAMFAQPKIDMSKTPFLTPFDIFGKYKTAKIDGVEYEGKGFHYYTKKGKILDKKISGTIEFGEQRTQKDIEKLVEYDTGLALELANKLPKIKLSGRKNDCGGAVGDILTKFGFSFFKREKGNMFSEVKGRIGDPNRYGASYENVLDELVAQGYFRVEYVDQPKDAKPGAVVVFRTGAKSRSASRARRAAGHVEIKGPDNKYYSYYSSYNDAGSAKANFVNKAQYARQTGFVGKVYYPIRKG